MNKERCNRLVDNPLNFDLRFWRKQRFLNFILLLFLRILYEKCVNKIDFQSLRYLLENSFIGYMKTLKILVSSLLAVGSIVIFKSQRNYAYNFTGLALDANTVMKSIASSKLKVKNELRKITFTCPITVYQIRTRFHRK